LGCKKSKNESIAPFGDNREIIVNDSAMVINNATDNLISLIGAGQTLLNYKS
jgi:hypothetical protein